jgi:hypothetical protein
VSSSDEGLSGGGSDEEVVAGMFREEASKEKLGFESHWDSVVGAEEVEAERGKSGNREDDTVGGYVSCPSPAAGKVAVVTGGEGSSEGSMAGASCRAGGGAGRWGPRLFWDRAMRLRRLTRWTGGAERSLVYGLLFTSSIWADFRCSGETYNEL